MNVVMTLASSTMKITGLRKRCRGSSLRKESRIAAKTISFVKTLVPAPRALQFPYSLIRLLVQSQVQLQDVDAGLAEEPERATVGRLLDELLHPLRRQVSLLRDPRRL